MKEKNRRNPKKQKQEQEEKRVNIERRQVSVLAKSKNLKSTFDFEWPEWTKETDRIKANTKRYADVPIAEVFGVKVDQVPGYQETPRELHVGEIIKVDIDNVATSKLSGCATKQILLSAVNLGKYKIMQEVSNTHPLLLKNLDAEVVRANRETVYVDVIKPMFDGWLQPILKDPDVQRNVKLAQTIKVKNLQLTRGGFIGQAVIPVVSAFVGQEYTVEAFIPGSQIVLNIESDFEQWVGQDVEAFVTNYIPKPGEREKMSLVCSRKDYLKLQGDKNIIKLFGMYCDNDEKWTKETEKKHLGLVTGIINSSKKCGVFVEIPSLSITGMIEMPPANLCDFKPGDEVRVNIVDFEENTYFDPVVKQYVHDAPYEIEDGVLRSCNIKPILRLVE